MPSAVLPANAQLDFGDLIPGAQLPPGYSLDAGGPSPSSVNFTDLVPKGQLPSGFKVDPPDILSGTTNEASKWATFGLADPVAAAGRALVQPLLGEGTDTNFAGRYERNLQQQRGGEASFAEAHPVANDIAAAAGALASAAPAMGWPTAIQGAAKGANLGPLIADATVKAPSSVVGQMGTGTGIGAVQGAANWPDSPLQGALFGAVGGAALAPLAAGALKLASVPIDAFSRRFLNGADTQALDRIAGRVSQDTGAGGPGISDMQTALANASGKPLSLADVGGENVQALAGSAARIPGAGRETATNFLADRAGQAGPRLVGDIDSAFGNQNAFATAQDLMQQRATAAKPLWDQFYSAAPLNPDAVAPGGDLTNLMTRPAMKAAAQRALGIAAEEGRNPNSLGITFNEAGDPAFQQVPSWQTLDYMKRGLDDVINGLPKNPLTGRLQPDEAGRAILGTKNTFLNFLDQNNPAYAAARDAYAGPSASLSALQQGQNFRSLRPEQIQYTLGNMSPSEREFFRVGAADAMRTSASQTGDARSIIGSNAVNNRGADYMKQQLRPLFDNDNDFNNFINSAQNENLMLANTNKLVGGSPSAARAAEDHGPSTAGAEALGHGAAALASVAEQNPLALAISLPRAVGSIRRLFGDTGNNPAVNAAVSRRLYSADQGANADTLAALLARINRPSVPAQLSVPVASYAGSTPLTPTRVGASLASVLSNLYPGDVAK